MFSTLILLCLYSRNTTDFKMSYLFLFLCHQCPWNKIVLVIVRRICLGMMSTSDNPRMITWAWCQSSNYLRIMSTSWYLRIWCEPPDYEKDVNLLITIMMSTPWLSEDDVKLLITWEWCQPSNYLRRDQPHECKNDVNLLITWEGTNLLTTRMMLTSWLPENDVELFIIWERR